MTGDTAVPDVSVVIPTHDRLACLRQCLDALAPQQFDPGRMEVIVVADGCTDGTAAALAEASYPYRLRVISQPASGASAARNRGAEAARAPLLIFLDDDVVPSPGLVGAHVRGHDTPERRVAVGPYPLVDPAPGDYLREHLHRYWTSKLEGMAVVEGRAPGFRDIVTGNLSVQADTFRQVGGFSTSFRRLEDYEFGVRILAAGVRFVFLPDAHAVHLETTDLRRSFRTTRSVGAAEVRLAELHPQTFPGLRLARPDPLSSRLAFRHPRISEALARSGELLLAAAQRLRLRRLWDRTYGRLKVYWYWRGVADAVEDYGEWRRRRIAEQ